MRSAIASHASPNVSVWTPASCTTPLIRQAYSRLTQHRVLERVQTDAAEVQRLLVERLRVECRTLSRLVLVADLLPDALADLVRRRLPRPAEVAVDLECDEFRRDVHVLRHEVEGVVSGPGSLAVGALLLQVDPDVEDHAGRTHPLPIEHPQPVGGVVEVAELFHESLRVKRPALGVARRPREEAAVAVQRRAVVDGLRDLEVMAGNSLVVDGRELTPGVELRDALRHRPPHPTGAGEVVRWPRVVDDAGVARGDHALERADLLRDVEV